MNAYPSFPPAFDSVFLNIATRDFESARNILLEEKLSADISPEYNAALNIADFTLATVSTDAKISQSDLRAAEQVVSEFRLSAISRLVAANKLLAEVNSGNYAIRDSAIAFLDPPEHVSEWMIHNGLSKELQLLDLTRKRILHVLAATGDDEGAFTTENTFEVKH